MESKSSKSNDSARPAPSKAAPGEPARKSVMASGSQQINLGGNKLRVDQPGDDGPRQRMSKADRKALRRQQQEERSERYR